MSEVQSPKTDAESRFHISKWIFPAGHLHPAAGVIKAEQAFFYAGLQTSTKLMSEAIPLIDELRKCESEDEGEIEKKKREVQKVILKSLSEYGKFQHDFNVSVGGRGRREGTGINIHMNAGIAPPSEKKGVLERLGLRKKEEGIGTRPSDLK